MDNSSNWKNDKETFIFSLNKNRKYKKAYQSIYSLYCSSTYGMYTAGFGNCSRCKTMKKFCHYTNIEDFYENGSEILPSKRETKYYELLEVEVFKVSFI